VYSQVAHLDTVRESWVIVVTVIVTGQRIALPDADEVS